MAVYKNKLPPCLLHSPSTSSKWALGNNSKNVLVQPCLFNELHLYI